MGNVIKFEKKKDEEQEHAFVIDQNSIGINRISVLPVQTIIDFIDGKLKINDIEDIESLMRCICQDFLTYTYEDPTC